MRLAARFVTLVILAALATVAHSHEQKLEGTEWGIVGDSGDNARFLSFAGQGRIFGFGGCNRLAGTFEQHDSHLAISPASATSKSCEPEVMARETEFLDMLQKVRGAQVDHTLLLLLDEKGADLRTLLRRNTEPATSDE